MLSSIPVELYMNHSNRDANHSAEISQNLRSAVLVSCFIFNVYIVCSPLSSSVVSNLLFPKSDASVGLFDSIKNIFCSTFYLITYFS